MEVFCRLDGLKCVDLSALVFKPEVYKSEIFKSEIFKSEINSGNCYEKIRAKSFFSFNVSADESAGNSAAA